MNLIQKGRSQGTINLIKKRFREARDKRQPLEFPTHKIPRELLQQLLVVCGKVDRHDAEIYREKVEEIGAEFVEVRAKNWTEVRDHIRLSFREGQHAAILLIGTSEQLPSHPLKYQDSTAYTDWFFQDVDGDLVPEVPVGRVFGSPETVLGHLDPDIIDSDIAVIFDSEPGRSDRHLVALTKLGFHVEVLERFEPEDADLLAASEFVLQFSDGKYTRRIHGCPEAWLSHNSVILSYKQANQIPFKGYPVVFSEACSTAQEGPLLRAFLERRACYIGAPLDTLNNVRPFEDWRECAYADGWKFGFLDLLDSYDTIGQVKVNVDREIFENLSGWIKECVRKLAAFGATKIHYDETLSVVEWNLFGNPMRISTRGPNAAFTPGRIIVDT
ncbi:MAG: hypothetical protein ACTSPE_13235 [Candidatus Thorarchaeota archaeon]